MRRILVIQTAHLGDLVLTIPLLRALQDHEAGVRLTLLTHPQGAALLRSHPAVDEILVYDKRAGLGELRRVGSRLAAGSWSSAVVPHRSLRSGCLAWLSRAPRRIGFAGAAGAWAYGQRVAWRSDEHATRRYLRLAEGLGWSPGDELPSPTLVVSSAARDSVDRRLQRAGVPPDAPLLAIAPGAKWATKQWTPEGFAAIVQAAPSRGLVPVLIGAADERELCCRVAGESGPAVVLAGDTGIEELVALLDRARVLVGNDSGPGHVAGAVGTPVVSVFGPTVPAFGYTVCGSNHRIVEHGQLPCRPCHRHGPNRCPEGHFRCMRELVPERVLGCLDSLLPRTDTTSLCR